MKQKNNIFYPASYLAMTVTSLIFLTAVSGLGAILINYWFNGVSNILNDVFVLYWIAALVVVLPLHLRAYRQVRYVDKSQVTPFSIRWAHGILGGYLLILIGSNIALGAWLGAIVLNALVGSGDIDKQLFATVLSLLQAIAWIAYTAHHFIFARGDFSTPKYYIWAISGLSAVVLVLSIVFPALAYRDVAHDFKKEKDLNHIQQSIGDYVDVHDTLPTKLTDLKGLPDETKRRLADYQYAQKGETKLGIFGYELCATFARSNDKGRDTGFGFASHSAGKQCYVRTAISFNKLNQGLAQYIKGVSNGAAKLQLAVQNFLVGAKQAIDQEVTGVEAFASGQVKQLEGNLEGLEGGTGELDQEMKRLESNLTTLGGSLGGLQGNTGQLAQDFAAVEKFLHDLGCIFGGPGCQQSSN